MNVRHSRAGLIRNTSAFSLVEMLLVMLVLSVLGSTSAFVTQSSMAVYAKAMPAMRASYESGLALEWLKRDLRSLSDTSSITVWTASQLDMVDLDGSAVAYRHSGTELSRNGDLVARDLVDFRFHYHGPDGLPVAQISDLALVELEWVAVHGGVKLPFHAAVAPRALTP